MQFNIEEILLIAKKIENNGYHFYTAAAEANEEHREWLTELAQEEIGHESAIDDFARSFVAPQDDPDDPDNLVLLYLHSIADSLIFSAGQDPRTFFNKEVTIDEIIEDGLRREHEAVAYYSALKDVMVDEDAKAQVDLLVKEEKNHIAWLRRKQEEIENERTQQNKEKIYELIIIGAGPGGISMAAEAISAGIESEKILILEGAPKSSWMIRKLYPNKHLVTTSYKGESTPSKGVLKMRDMSKESIVQMLSDAVEDFGINIVYNCPVSAVDKKDGLFSFQGKDGTYKAKYGVISIGIFGRPNRPDYTIHPEIEDRVRFEIDVVNVRNSKVLVVGGGDTAAEFIQELLKFGNNITLSCREKNFEMMNNTNRRKVETAKVAKSIQVLAGSDISEISAHNDGIQVFFKNENPEEMIFDYIIYALGGTTAKKLLNITGIFMRGKRPTLSAANESNIPGLYLTGDLAARSEIGTIAAAFNSSFYAAQDLVQKYFPQLSAKAESSSPKQS
ncbi:MAG: hypothetical protein DWQ05_14585 [Calditrichaeota bacterium]|nr:MAG: hypothetical protein DWQ05_14585 [Calditrichota bacterium]